MIKFQGSHFKGFLWVQCSTKNAIASGYVLIILLLPNTYINIYIYIKLWLTHSNKWVHPKCFHSWLWKIWFLLMNTFIPNSLSKCTVHPRHSHMLHIKCDWFMHVLQRMILVNFIHFIHNLSHSVRTFQFILVNCFFIKLSYNIGMLWFILVNQFIFNSAIAYTIHCSESH